MNIYASRVVLLNRDQQESYLQALSSKSRAKIDGYRHSEDASRALAAILLLQYVVKAHLGLELRDDLLAYNDFGKPYLPAYPAFHFNISHSGQWAVCAVDETPVGIDIEEVLPADYLALAGGFFSREEHQQLLSRSAPDRLDYFYSLWTARESYVKALGKGLFIPLDSFSISVGGNNVFTPRDGEHGGRKMFIRQYQLDKDYKLAVCAEHGSFPNTILIIDVMAGCNHVEQHNSDFNIEENKT